jgi:hypothetical protein
VSPNGNDTTGDGSLVSPWKTLKHAAREVPANQGHTIRLAAGHYTEQGPIEIPPGVSVEGAGRNLTVLTAASAFYYHPASPGYAADKFLLSLKSVNPVEGNQSLKNFSVDGEQKQLHGGVIIFNRSGVLIDGVKVEETNFTGIWLWNVKDGKILNTNLINCSWGSAGYCSGALNLGNVERLEIDQLNVDESVGYGIKAIGPNGDNNISSLKIHDSRVSVNPYGLWNNGSAPNIAIELWQVNLRDCEIFNCYVDNTISLVNSNSPPSSGQLSIRVHHNMLDLDTRAKGAGYGVELSINDAEIDHNYFLKGSYGIVNWDNPVSNWNIHHNVFYALGGVYPGDVLRSQVSGLHKVNFYNNTIEFSGDKTINVVGIYGGSSENVSMVNNLFINNNTAYSYYPNSLIRRENGATLNSLAVKNNMFHKLPIGTVSGTYSGNFSGDPKISKTGTRPDHYYYPLSGSPLIDRGLNVALAFLGLAPDIGAYEFTSTLINLKPQVTLTSPSNNTTVAPGTTVSLIAAASDLDGNVTKVEFFQGATKLAEDSNSPYTYSWDPPAGSYSVTAKATDNLGATTVSGAIAITVQDQNQAPVAAILTPKNNAKFKTGSTIAITASAVDQDGAVAKVEFFNGENKIGEDSSSPYSFDWADAPAGTHSLTVKAIDNNGATSVSSAVTVRVADVIKVGLYAPDATLQGNMTLTADITASRGKYFAMPSGSGTNFYIPPPSSAQFTFDLPESDTYVAWVRMRSPAEKSQGYHVYDGKGHWTSWLAGIHPAWTWVEVTDAYTNGVATFPFTAGPNVFRMAWFHENVQVDRILITNDTAYIPTDESEIVTDPPITLGLYAPDAALAGNMKLSADSTASKGSYFSMPVGSGTNFYIPPPSSAQFAFELPKTDTYFAWVRLRSPSEKSQGFHVYDGKGHWTSWLAGVHPEWTWVEVTDAYTNKTATFPFTEGTNIFRMAWFHENVQVDRVLITNNPAFIPSSEKEVSTARVSVPTVEKTTEADEPGTIAVFPNPVKDKLMITYTSSTAQQAHINIQSTGSPVAQQLLIPLEEGLNNITVSTDSLERGVYVVTIQTPDGKRSLAKIVVAK